MALLGNPFVANADRPLSAGELAQALRVDIAGELEAIIGYEAHASTAADDKVKALLLHIADEERRHVGQLEQALMTLSAKDAQFIEAGRQSVRQQMEKMQ
jgi:uncharacterized protein